MVWEGHAVLFFASLVARSRSVLYAPMTYMLFVDENFCCLALSLFFGITIA